MSSEKNSSEDFLGSGCENFFGNGTINFNPENIGKEHIFVIGTTGAGKTSILPGTPIEPNEEVIKAMEEREKEEQRQECIRNQAIKQTYVDHAGDISFIDDMVKYAELTPYDTNIPKEKLIQILFLLDDDVFFKGLRWEFDDTEVREDLYEWIEENQEPVKLILEQS